MSEDAEEQSQGQAAFVEGWITAEQLSPEVRGKISEIRGSLILQELGSGGGTSAHSSNLLA